ncbi:uncharacterized protein LOC100213006 isoform X5 [Hydra vulgaris]|uniref:Uncharacterized protein LOC100213006 isoform X5 n=1 Tax=Hydra vulgaris TaxID=6087 RepID=A0ABM4BL00_HYDVU
MADGKEEIYEHENVQYQDEAAKNSQISLQTDVFISEQSSRMQEILFQASDSDENVVLTTNDGENIVLYVEEGTHVAGFQDLIRVALDQSMSSSNQASINNELKFESIQKEQQQSLDLPVIIDCTQVLTGDELTIDVSEKLNESSESNKFLDRSSTEMDNLFQLAKLSGGISLQCGKELERTLQGVEDQRVKNTNVDIDPNDLVSEFTIENEENEAKVIVPGEFNIGDSFYSLEEVEESLRIYEEKHNVKLYKRDVRSLDALLKRSLKLQKLDKVNKSLKYGQLLYCCVYGGKRKAQKIACIDASGVARFTDCRMFIRFAISDDGMTLVVNGKLEEHCHDEIVSHSFEPEEPLYETNSGNAEEIRLGAGYTDLEELYKAIYKYETDNHVHLWRRDGRTIEALAKRAPGTAKKIMETNPGLRFAELRFCCSYGGRQISDEKKEKLMGSSSLRISEIMTAICVSKKMMSSYPDEIPDQYITSDDGDRKHLGPNQNKSTLYFSNESALYPIQDKKTDKKKAECVAAESSSKPMFLGLKRKADFYLSHNDYGDTIDFNTDFNTEVAKYAPDVPSSVNNKQSTINICSLQKKNSIKSASETTSKEQISVCSNDVTTRFFKDSVQKNESTSHFVLNNFQLNRLQDFKIFNDLDSFNIALEKVKRETLTAYCVVMSSRNYSKQVNLEDVVKDYSHSFKKNELPCIRWHLNSGHLSIPFLGYPFIVLGHAQYHCAQGKDKSLSRKRLLNLKTNKQDETLQKRHLARPTKKFGCPVSFLVKKIYAFPEYTMSKDTKRNRTEVSVAIKQKMKLFIEAKKKGKIVEELGVLMYLTKEFPLANAHRYHLENRDFIKGSEKNLLSNTLYPGAKFNSYKEAVEAVGLYREARNVKLYCNSDEAIPINNVSLRYDSLKYVCYNAFEKKKYCGKGKNRRVINSFKVGCEMHIRFGVSDDGSQLIVKSMSEDHNHEINEEAVVKEALHPELCSHVSKLVWNDPSIPIDEVKRLLELYVVKEMFKDQVPPPRTRRQYFPTKKQIRYFMSKARSSLNISHDVEQKLEAQAEVLKEKHNDEKMIFNFKVKHDTSLESTVQNDDSVEAAEDFISDEKDLKNELNENAKLLFCHQTPHQQRLLKRYNSQIILTQIKDIHARIPFPLYCIYVQTNVDYQLVAEFILQTNTVAMLSEGLQTIKDWNPGWNPKFVVCDYSDVQIEAVEASFNGSFILISDSSREKAWKDWLSDDQNGVSEHQDEMLMHLKAIAQSFSEETLNAAARELEESEVWKTSDKLRNWFQFNWLAHAKRWVSGYRPDDYLMTCHNNRTLEDELKVFRSIKLVNKTTPLQDVIQQLVEHVVPVACKQYYDLNKESIKLHNDLRYAYSNIPNYLCARPGLITYHIYERLKKANEQSFTIRCMHSGIFTVQGDTNEEDHLHTVSFGDANCFPSCDCEDWLRFKLPCEHFCAIYNNFPGWNWDMMSNLYKFLPQLNIDWGCETNINIDMPGLFVDNSTQTSPVKDMVGGEHNLFFGVTDKRNSHETPQVLASQCRGLLQQLSKLQLAHHSRENLCRLKTELKELIAIFSNAANKDKQLIVNSGSIENSSVQLKSLGRPRKNVSAPSIALNHDLSITKEDAQSHIRPLQTRKTYPQRHQEVDKVNAIGVATVFKNIRQSSKNETVKIVSQKRSISDSHDECPAKLSKEDNCVKEEDGDFDLQGIGPPSIETSCLTTVIDGKTIEIPLENIRTAIGTASNSLNISQTVLASEELIPEDDAVK